MPSLKHQHFKPQKSRPDHHYLICAFITLLSLVYLVDCKTLNEITNSTDLNENFKYDPATFHLGSNSITSIELLKNNANSNGVQTAHCGCPPKGQFSHSNLITPEDVPCWFSLNAEIIYACKSGYTKASGSDKLNCVMNNGKAEWSGKPLNCKIITCDDPGEVAHATRIVKDPNFSFNSQVSYRCDNNYMSDSKPVILCNRNGQWNRKKPVCKLIQCAHLSQPDPNLIIEYIDPDRKVNSTVNFHCRLGYHLDDENAVRQCEWNGNWTGSNPTCIPNYCELPENRSSDLIIIPLKERYEPNEKVNYKCKLSKKYSVAKCGSENEFNIQLPTECPKPKKTHCQPVELQHGEVNSSSPPLDEFVIGAKLSFKCNNHYILNEENKEIFCMHNGEWSSNIPRCLDLATIRTSQILSYILTCIIIILILIIAITAVLLFRWRQKQLQKRQWQRYFCNLEYPHCDKTKVQTNSSQEMHIFQAQRISVPFTDL